MKEIVVGSFLYFPPFLGILIVGFIVWYLVHSLIRGWLYSGKVWHPALCDLCLVIISVSVSGLLLLP